MKKFLFTIISLFCLSVFSQENETSQQFQDELNIQYATKDKSPLTEADFKDFKGLDFFPIDSTFIIKATFIRTDQEKPFPMKTSTKRLPLYVKYGELHFVINGTQCQLNVYQNADPKKDLFWDHLFLPFTDLTSGNESYGGGRYIDITISSENIWTIDFNKAYNPYCAYNKNYSCPIVPPENDLPVAITAGVKKFH